MAEKALVHRMEQAALTTKIRLLDLAHQTLIHIGGDLSVCDMMTAIWQYAIHYDVKNPHWEGRDRFVLSKGHAAAVTSFSQAAIGCYDVGDIYKEYATNFGRFGMHSCNLANPYVDVSTGSLGHGFPVACGMATALKRKGSSSRVYTVVGDGELATLESFRFEYNGKTLYPSKGECEILDEFGRVVDPTTKIPAEGATYYVKLKGSQFGDGPDGWANVHYSGEAGCQGTAKVTRVFRADEGCGVSVMEEHTVEVAAGYAYSGGWTATCHIDRLYLHLKGNEKGDLSDFRIEAGAGQFFYAKDHAGMIQDLDGNPIDLSTKIGDYVDEKTNKSMDIVIDLAAAGIDLKKGDAFHFHNTYTEEGTSITFGAALGVANDVPAEIALAEYVQDWAK